MSIRAPARRAARVEITPLGVDECPDGFEVEVADRACVEAGVSPRIAFEASTPIASAEPAWRSAGPMNPAPSVLLQMARRLLRVTVGE